MELVLFGLFVWGVYAMIKAGVRRRDEERAQADARRAELARQADARRAELARQVEQQRWLSSLQGSFNGRSRFSMALEDNLRRDDWNGVMALIGAVPDWPIRKQVYLAVTRSLKLRENTFLAAAGGVPRESCAQFMDAAMHQETALWQILDRVAVLAQIEGETDWRRLSRSVRRGVAADEREVVRTVRRIEAAIDKLSELVATQNRRSQRWAGRPLDRAVEVENHVDRIMRYRER